MGFCALLPGGKEMYQRSGLPWTKYWDFILLDMLSMVLAMVAAY